MKILIICNSASGLNDFRGMLIQELISAGNTVSAIIPVSSVDVEKYAEKELKKKHCNLIRVPMERRGMNPLKDFKLLLNYKKSISEKRPDLVITYTIKPNIYGGIASRLLKVPYAVNITGLGTAFQNNGFLRKFVTILYKFSLRKAKVVFFENVGNRDIMVDTGIIKKEKTYVLNGAGIDLEKFTYQPYPEDDNCVHFLFIGRVMKEKGIEELFQAMQKLQKTEFHCTLDILGGYEEAYEERIQAYEEEGWLNYHGFQKDVKPFIKDSHCSVLPSWHEGMANTNLECAASGRPVITSNFHGCMEAVIEGESGFLCERKNAESLYTEMLKFINLSLKEKEEMGIKGRKHMEDVFDKRKVVEITIKQLFV